jgi:hypothetical protein
MLIFVQKTTIVGNLNYLFEFVFSIQLKFIENI